MRTNDRYWGLRMPSELHDQLVERARKEERTPAGIMRLLARLYVESAPGALLDPWGSAGQADPAGIEPIGNPDRPSARAVPSKT